MDSIELIRALKLDNINGNNRFVLKDKIKLPLLKRFFNKGDDTIYKLLTEYGGIFTGSRCLKLQRFCDKPILDRNTKSSDWDIILTETMYNKAKFDGLLNLNELIIKDDVLSCHIGLKNHNNIYGRSYQSYKSKIDIILKSDIDYQSTPIFDIDGIKYNRGDDIFKYLKKMDRKDDMYHFIDKFAYCFK